MTYPTEVGPAGSGGRIASIEPESPADHAGLRVGEVIVSVEGQPLRDVVDWLWLADGATVALTVEDTDGDTYETILEREWFQPWGFEFDGVVFDGIRECDNACSFCFVAQLPEGLRPSLYVRDDDYRLSFLAGNFVTLTNLSDEDVDRVIEQRLSPLHVSLHAVDEDVRRRLMCPGVEDRALEFVDRLTAAGIELHVQFVLVPGVNDGDVLERSLEWLEARDGIVSVGVVPVGATRFQTRIARRYDSPEACAAVLGQVARWAERMRTERAVGWVYAADEFYLQAGETLPAWDDYDGFPQFENGIGMTRAFLDECSEALREAPDAPDSMTRPQVTLVTGELFAPVLDALAPPLARTGCDVRVLAVRNGMLGGNVNVAGLLAGSDIAKTVSADACARMGGAEIYLVPEIVTNDDGLLLDDLTLIELRSRAGQDVRLVSSDAAGLVCALRELSSTT